MSVLAVVRQQERVADHTPTPDKISGYAKGPCTKCQCSKFNSDYYALCKGCGHLEYLHQKLGESEDRNQSENELDISASLAESKEQLRAEEEEEEDYYSSSSSSEEEEEREERGWGFLS